MHPMHKFFCNSFVSCFRLQLPASLFTAFTLATQCQILPPLHLPRHLLTRLLHQLVEYLLLPNCYPVRNFWKGIVLLPPPLPNPPKLRPLKPLKSPCDIPGDGFKLTPSLEFLTYFLKTMYLFCWYKPIILRSLSLVTPKMY